MIRTVSPHCFLDRKSQGEAVLGRLAQGVGVGEGKAGGGRKGGTGQGKGGAMGRLAWQGVVPGSGTWTGS